MSLGKHTECDLCADIAKLDVQHLEEQLRYRFFGLANSIYGEAKDIAHVLTIEEQKEAVSHVVCTQGDRIQTLAKQLCRTAELLYTIQGSITREIELVNLLPRLE